MCLAFGVEGETEGNGPSEVGINRQLQQVPWRESYHAECMYHLRDQGRLARVAGLLLKLPLDSKHWCVQKAWLTLERM